VEKNENASKNVQRILGFKPASSTVPSQLKKCKSNPSVAGDDRLTETKQNTLLTDRRGRRSLQKILPHEKKNAPQKS